MLVFFILSLYIFSLHADRILKVQSEIFRFRFHFSEILLSPPIALYLGQSIQEWTK